MNRAQLNVMAMGAAYRAQKEFHVDPTLRVDVFKVLREAGAYVFFRPLKSMYGAYLPLADSVGLLINSNLPLSVQRYTAAHEFGHFYLKHKTLSLEKDLDFVPENRAPVDEDEVVAEAFAAFFLMPKPLVVNSIRDLEITPSKINSTDAYLLALRMGTSYRATVNQLHTYKLINKSHAVDLKQSVPKEIKQKLNDDEKVGRHDVWLLDENWHGKHIYPAPSDTIRIRLKEIPSSGYTWLLGDEPQGVSIREEGYREEESGIGGVRIHYFTAHLDENAHTTTLKLEKKRPWERSKMEDFAVAVHPQEFRKTGPLVLPKLA
jgi:Zn-dependent peptidase ImmA (M78 family)/predicted secreted protein